MLQNIKHNYPRPQRGRISATTKVVVDSSPTGSGTLPFFFFWNVEFLRNLFWSDHWSLFLHSTKPRWGLLFFVHFSVPTQLIFFCTESEGFSCYKNIEHNYPRPQRGRMSTTSRGGGWFDPYRVGDASFPFFLKRGIPSEFILGWHHWWISASPYLCLYSHEIHLYGIRRILMFHKKPQVYARPQRGRISATSWGGGLFDPYRVADASFPFFLERGIPSEFLLIISHDHCSCFSMQPRWGLLFFDHFFERGIPSGYRLGRHLLEPAKSFFSTSTIENSIP